MIAVIFVAPALLYHGRIACCRLIQSLQYSAHHRGCTSHANVKDPGRNGNIQGLPRGHDTQETFRYWIAPLSIVLTSLVALAPSYDLSDVVSFARSNFAATARLRRSYCIQSSLERSSRLWIDFRSYFAKSRARAVRTTNTSRLKREGPRCLD